MRARSAAARESVRTRRPREVMKGRKYMVAASELSAAGDMGIKNKVKLLYRLSLMGIRRRGIAIYFIPLISSGSGPSTCVSHEFILGKLSILPSMAISLSDH